MRFITASICVVYVNKCVLAGESVVDLANLLFFVFDHGNKKYAIRILCYSYIITFHLFDEYSYKDMGTDNIPLSMLQPPIVVENDEPKPLASIPLSKLFNPAEEAICPLCGQLLPMDAKERIIDGEPYLCCKKCR